MSPRSRLAVLISLLVAGLATSLAGAAATESVTASGVGQVKLGMTYKQLRAKHLIGPIRKGCELGGPNTRSANLRPPLKGLVDFTMTTVRRVTDITVSAGAAAKGVGIGATIAQIKAAFPKAKVDHSSDVTFGFTLVRVPKAGGGRFEFAVGTKSHKVSIIGVPIIAVCE